MLAIRTGVGSSSINSTSRCSSHARPLCLSRSGRPLAALPALQGNSGRARGSSWTTHAAAGGGAGSIGGSGGGSGSSGSSGGAGDGSKEPRALRLWTLLYAGLLAVGGIAAFVTKNSTKSLTSAGGAALILALSARTMAGPQAKASIAVCLALALLLSVVMAGRFSRTKKVMPAAMTAGVSLAMSAAYIGALLA